MHKYSVAYKVIKQSIDNPHPVNYQLPGTDAVSSLLPTIFNNKVFWYHYDDRHYQVENSSDSKQEVKQTM